MPIYEYVCSSCSHEWSDLVPKHDSPFPDCPECEGKEVEKLFSMFASNAKDTSGPSMPASGGHSCGTGGCGCRH